MKKESRKRVDSGIRNNTISKVNTVEIKRLRLAKGLTMREAAKRAGLNSHPHWHLVESGKIADPRISMIYKMANALGVKPGRLLKR